jgi:hypothetical protein
VVDAHSGRRANGGRTSICRPERSAASVEERRAGSASTWAASGHPAPSRCGRPRLDMIPPPAVPLHRDGDVSRQAHVARTVGVAKDLDGAAARRRRSGGTLDDLRGSRARARRSCSKAILSGRRAGGGIDRVVNWLVAGPLGVTPAWPDSPCRQIGGASERRADRPAWKHGGFLPPTRRPSLQWRHRRRPSDGKSSRERW